MSRVLTFNPISGTFDFVDEGGNYWQAPVANTTDLPLTDPEGTVRVVKADDKVYVWDATSSKWIDTGLSLAAFNAAASATGLTISTSTTGNITSRTLQLNKADATNPGALSVDAQTIGGLKTFNDGIKSDSLQTKSTTATLSIGTDGNADTINIGDSGSVVNIYGTSNIIESTNLLVKDKIITINDGGAATSGGESGLEVEENAAITGYNKTSSDRNSWQLKAPNTAGIATITPGAGGITLDQSSHNPVTISDTNSVNLTLATQALSADVKISSNAADVSNQLVNLNIESTSSTGLRAQIPNSSITGLISVSDTNSIDMSYTTGQVSGDVRISANAADVGNTKVALNIESATSLGLRAQIPHAGAAAEGSVNTTTQTFSGVKTFADDISITGLSGSIITSDSVETSIEQLDESINNLVETGFLSWGAGTTYYTITGGALRIDRGGIGFIKGKKITFTAPQTTAVFSANTTNYVYIDSTGTIGSTSTYVTNLFEDYILLFECLYDGTNYTVVKENHPYKFDASVSGYLHNNVGSIIRSAGANITRVTTGNGSATTDRELKIVTADILDDHGLETTISDSAGAGVSWKVFYTNAAGKWILYADQTQLPMFYNNAGTPTALLTGLTSRITVYTLYCCKDSLNSSTTTYFAVMNNSVYDTNAQANTAITNNTIARATNELSQLEFAQLGYAIVRNNVSGGFITTAVIAKSSFNSKIVSSGAVTTALLVTTDTSDFNGILSATDTTVQIALETIDDIGLSTDINPTSFSAANNTASQNITDFSFSASTVRAFEALVSVSVDATADLFQVFTLRGVYTGASWDMSETHNGQDSLATFAITNAGQVQVTTPSYAGFVSCTIKFRAITLAQ